jgi:hypothetical protein
MLTTFNPLIIIILFKDRVLLCNPGWPEASDSLPQLLRGCDYKCVLPCIALDALKIEHYRTRFGQDSAGNPLTQSQNGFSSPLN